MARALDALALLAGLALGLLVLGFTLLMIWGP